MSDISAVTGQDVANSKATSAGLGLADNFDNFLTLLTTQLQYQDPLEPMDPNEFTDSLVKLTAVEQSIATNLNLEKLITAFNANKSASVVNFIGKQIEAPGNAAVLKDGSAKWSYTLLDNAELATIKVLDESGTAVFTTSGELSTGAHDFEWDGNDNAGVPKPDGIYTIIVNAIDAEGNEVGSTTSFVGVVSGVETFDDQIVFDVGGINVPFDSVTKVTLPDDDEEPL